MGTNNSLVSPPIRAGRSLFRYSRAEQAIRFNFICDYPTHYNNTYGRGDNLKRTCSATYYGPFLSFKKCAKFGKIFSLRAPTHSNKYVPSISLKRIGKNGSFDWSSISQSAHVRLYTHLHARLCKLLSSTRSIYSTVCARLFFPTVRAS